jgi:hypothetical protein
MINCLTIQDSKRVNQSSTITRSMHWGRPSGLVWNWQEKGY